MDSSIFCSILLLIFIFSPISANIVFPKCQRQAKSCSFELDISPRTTMMRYPDGDSGEMIPISVDGDGHLFQRVSDRQTETIEKKLPLRDQDKKSIIFGDGSHRDVKVVNGQLPGTPIVVYEGQTIIAKVTNNLVNEVVTIHWHGMHQRGTNTMDGVQIITQCSIRPEYSFTYRFNASPKGTHWYHAHSGTLRTMGVYGPLIVLPSLAENERDLLERDHLPEFDNDFYMVIQEWTKQQSDNVNLYFHHNADHLGNGYNEKFFTPLDGVNGLKLGLVPIESIIINGKGCKYNSSASQKAENRGVELDIFEVQKGGNYRFRLINAGMYSLFRVSIDNHLLNVIASDGVDVLPKQVESIIIGNGERYDFWLEANDPKDVGNYWIRVKTLEMTQNGKPIPNAHAKAILRYKGAIKVDPQSNRQRCSGISPCKVLNCPYREYPEDEHMICIPVTELMRPNVDPIWQTDSDNFYEYIFNLKGVNYQLDSGSKMNTPTINGNKFKAFVSFKRLLFDPDLPITNSCESPYCSKDVCTCANVLSFKRGSVVQMTFFSDVDLIAGPHPYHIHGNYLQVLKIGWPNTEKDTKLYLSKSSDIKCKDDSCNHLIWTNPEWKGGNIPGLLQKAAPLKDTIVVPSGGYVVTRLRADNPGIWLSHCHMEFHNHEGMRMVFKIGSASDMATPPENFPRCSNFDANEDDFLQKIEKPVLTRTQLQQNLKIGGPQVAGQLSRQEFPHSKEESEFYKTMSITLGIAVGCLSLLNMYILFSTFKKKRINVKQRNEDGPSEETLLLT